METFNERLRRLAEERERIAAEEAEVRTEAMAELERVTAEIEVLEDRKAELEAFLGLNEPHQRAARGEITNLCVAVVADSPKPLTSGEVRELLEQRNPEMSLRSVPSTLSRLVSLGRMKRDTSGRYSLA